MWWNMKEWIEAGGWIPSDPMLRQELSTPTYWFDAQGRKALESKDEIKKRLQGGASPDIADALALTFAYPVGKRLPLEVRVRLKPVSQLDYDPYDKVG
jgi:phage terminase large subunit